MKSDGVFFVLERPGHEPLLGVNPPGPWPEPPARRKSDQYIGHLGRQDFDDELALHAEYPPPREEELTEPNWPGIISLVTAGVLSLGFWWFVLHKLFGR